MPAWGPRRGWAGRSVRPIFIDKAIKTLARRTMQELLRNGLARQAREKAERSRQGVPREVLMTQAMAIETRRAPTNAVSLFPLLCNGESAGAEYRGIRQRFPYR